MTSDRRAATALGHLADAPYHGANPHHRQFDASNRWWLEMTASQHLRVRIDSSFGGAGRLEALGHLGADAPQAWAGLLRVALEWSRRGSLPAACPGAFEGAPGRCARPHGLSRALWDAFLWTVSSA